MSFVKLGRAVQIDLSPYNIVASNYSKKISCFIGTFLKRRDQQKQLYDTRCYFNVRSKANMSQLNLPHGTDN